MNNKTKSKSVATLGMLFALSLTLSYIEALLPPLPFLPVGFKLGFSNIVTMYTLYFVGFMPAVVIAILKAMFQMFLRGATAGMLSLVGGLLSVAVMGLFVKLEKKGKISKSFISILGAVSHNIGQLVAASFLLKTSAVWYYSPIVVISGVVMGILMGTILNLTLNVLGNIKKS